MINSFLYIACSLTASPNAPTRFPATGATDVFGHEANRRFLARLAVVPRPGFTMMHLIQTNIFGQTDLAASSYEYWRQSGI